MAGKRSPKKEPPPSPLEAKRRALAEQERKLDEEIRRRQRLIEQAPKIKEQKEKLRREELIARAARTEVRFGTRAALQDPRYAYEAQLATGGRERRLKREQRRGMFTFFVLLLVLAGVFTWLYFTFVSAM